MQARPAAAANPLTAVNPLIPSGPEFIAGAVVVAVLALIIVLLIVLLVRSTRRAAAERITPEAARSRLNAELALREQAARLTIVRELTEVSLQSMGRVVTQAEGAAYAAQTDPAAAVRSATGIADAARTSVADLRRALTLIRDTEAQAGPEPTLDGIRDLTTLMYHAGLGIEFVEQGQRFALPNGAELALVRILQEALANALQHGGAGTTASVLLQWSAEGVRLQVDDDGERARAKREGRDPNDPKQRRQYTVQDDLQSLTEQVAGIGITEMRQRAELFGGAFDARPVPGVGFSVSAVFPDLRGRAAASGRRFSPDAPGAPTRGAAGF